MRTPDPSLDTLGKEHVAVAYRGPLPATAHRLALPPRHESNAGGYNYPKCNTVKYDWWARIPACDAAYIAVPCRECFGG